MRLTSDIYLEDLFGLDSVFTFRGPVSGSFLMRLYLEGVMATWVMHLFDWLWGGQLTEIRLSHSAS